MRKLWLATVAAVLAALLPGITSALDAPHDASFSDGACERCHGLFVQTATGDYDYNNGCTTCHDANPSLSFKFPWRSTDQAQPGVTGNHHSWSGQAVNTLHGSTPSTSTTLQSTLVDGRLQCVTCHDPHTSVPADPASKHTSIPLNTPVDETGNALGAGGTAQMTLVSVGSSPKSFRLRVLDAGGGARSVVISHDFGLATPSWLNYVGGAWVVGTLAGPGYAITPGANITLDDPAVVVKFSAAPAPGDFWDFYFAFPYLRFTNVNDSICSVCHLERSMNHVRARGEDTNYLPNGVRRFSHPVGVALNANGLGLDAAAIADANGLAQPGDTNATNDLVLRSGMVQCTTCHAVHNADSNSFTTDAR